MSKDCPKCGRAMTLCRMEKLVTGTVWAFKCLHCQKILYPQWDEETEIQREMDGPRRERTQGAMAI